MNLSCLRASSLMQRRAAGLSAAAGLQLEEHLASCSSCRERASSLDRLRALHSSGVRTLSVEQRARVIAASLGARVREDPVLPTFSALRWLAIPAFATLLVSLGWRMFPPHRAASHTTQHEPNAAPDAPTARGDRVLDGVIESAGVAYPAGHSLEASVELHAQDAATLALAHAIVTLRPETRAHWEASSHELQLHDGSVFVDVDETLHARFVVATARFSVLVLGTRFEVSLDGVKVWRGRVQVRALDGSELAVLEPATQSEFHFPKVTPPASARPALSVSRPGGSAQAPDPDALLAKAQVALAERNVTGARHVLARVLALELARDQRAEALSLRAECELVAGKFRAASAAYSAVAERFATLPAGQTALFAAARIEAEHGDREQARLLLTRYLERAPSGSFAKEAASRLKALGATSATP